MPTQAKVVRLRPKKPFKLKGIKRVKAKLADGRIEVYLYHRATGTKLDPNDLIQSYAAAEKKITQRGEATLVSLVRLFDGSSYFRGLSDASRKEYFWKLKRIETKWGT